MELYDFGEIRTAKSLTLPYEEIQLMPIGDVQLGADGVQVDRLKRQIDWAMAQNNVYFIGMGDYVDVMSPSNRDAWRGVKKYDSVESLMERGVRSLEKDFLSIVSGTEGRWLGLLEGHHFYEYADGTTSDTFITQQLRSRFLGTSAIVRIKFQDGTHIITCDIWCHHGWGSGKAPHSPLNKLYDAMAHFEGIDVFLMGHHTKKCGVKIPKLYMDRAGRLRDRQIVLAGTGGFYLGHKQNSRSIAGNARGSYAEKAGMSPVTLGSPLIRIRPRRHKDYDNLDLNVEI